MKRAKQVLYLVISLLVVIADQGLKDYIVTNFKIGDEHTVIPGVLSLTYLQNSGAIWNVLNGQMILFYLISIAAITVAIYYLFNPKYKNWFFDTSSALASGEITGNFIDRLHLKYIIDILQLDLVQFNIFNIADSATTVGIVLVFIHLIFMSEKD